MNADEAREQLEAEVWRAIAIDPNRASTVTCAARVDAVLAAADAYAGACAGDRVTGAVNGLARQRRAGTAPPAPRCACGAEIPPHPGRGPKPRKCPACRAEGWRAYMRAWSRDHRRRQRASARSCPDCGAARPDHLITCGTVPRATGEAS